MNESPRGVRPGTTWQRLSNIASGDGAGGTTSVVPWHLRRAADALHTLDAIVIGAVVLLNGVLGFVQENKAESALAALRLMTAANSTANGAVQRASPDKDRRRVPA